MSYLLIFLGGGAGSVLRYLISVKVGRMAMLGDFPIGIMAVNVLGSLLAGVALAQLAKNPGEFFVPLFMVGVLGGFTTFSAFSLEALQLFQAQKYLYAGLYVGGTLCLSLLAAFAGFVFSK